MRLSRCRQCGEPIIFALVGNQQGKPASRMPLNPAPDPAGNVACYRNAAYTLVGRVLGKKQALGYERVYMPHFATCKKPVGKRPENSPAEPTPKGVTSLNEWLARKRNGKPRTRHA